MPVTAYVTVTDGASFDDVLDATRLAILDASRYGALGDDVDYDHHGCRPECHALGAC
jgi:hypothetical protein